ncbi:hypothetical protein BRADI_3g24696v3 [Brachypodium distachyon]|uniref:Uncharacterized protein n=1 Tax=Brachypodium distachyon TaxID=15368 RepID=A0A0Q3FB89_BRADI|nr:hypothetical protein BRADI_3g24696v3 [Brachypodium distachyon]
MATPPAHHKAGPSPALILEEALVLRILQALQQHFSRRVAGLWARTGQAWARWSSPPLFLIRQLQSPDSLPPPASVSSPPQLVKSPVPPAPVTSLDLVFLFA